MRALPVFIVLVLALLVTPTAAQEERLTSPYRQQAQNGLRGLDRNELAELEAGRGMGLARAAELNSYPGPRHVLDAVAAGALAATPDQVQRVERIFAEMSREARRLGAQILEEERQLEAAFRTTAITDADLHTRVARIAALQGELRTVHLAAHLATRAVLSDVQIARYDELRGYTASTPQPPDHQHKH